MKLRVHAALLGFVLCFTSACSVVGKADVERMLVSGRDGWQHPERVVESLAIAQGDRVAEIGAGDGYWLPWLSEAVGDAGRVYAVEVSDEKVADLEERVADEGLENVVVVRGRFEDPMLPNGVIDLAMTCLTYHHIEERHVYFAKLRDDLSPRGRVAHLDDQPGMPIPIRWLQGTGHWSEAERVRDEMGQAGYQLIESYDYLPVQSFQVFSPSATAGAAR